MTSCHEEFKFIILTLTLWTVSLIIAMTIHLPPIESYETSPNEIKQQLKKKALTKKIKETKSHSPKGKNKNNKKQQKKNNKGKKNCSKKSPKKQVEQELTIEEQGRYVALDCEFVGVGPGGYKSALARVSMVDYENAVLIDTYVKVNEPVTDYRTFVSGITEEHLKSDLAMDADKCIDLVQRPIWVSSVWRCGVMLSRSARI